LRWPARAGRRIATRSASPIWSFQRPLQFPHGGASN